MSSGAPVDFGGMVLPQTNPPTPPPHLDTDAPSDTATPVATKPSIENYHTPRVQRLPEGMLVPGNIDLNQRPVVKNADGSVSTEYSTSFQDENGHEVLIPTVIDGRFFTPDGKKPPVGSAAEKKMIQAAIAYHRSDPTHPHLGVFESPEAASTYAEIAHSAKRNPKGEPMYVAPFLHPDRGPSMKTPEPQAPYPAIPKHSRTVNYPTGHVIAFPDHMSPAEFDKAAKAAWQKIKEQ